MPYKDPEKRKAYEKANLPRRAEYLRKYLKTHPEKRREYARRYHKKFPEFRLFDAARQRARKAGLEFTITRKDVKIPAVCPYLGIPIKLDASKTGGDWGGNPNSPSLDRIDSTKGYEKGNVEVISWRANALKKDATPEELMKIAARFMDIHGCKN